MDLVSIVMCTYNGEKYLKEQLDSILSQTYNKFELIICDDNSSDDTNQIIENYCKKDSRIKYFKNKENLGYIKNFEKGISLTKGEYISLADQDDIWDIFKTEKLVNKIGDNDLVYCDSRFVDEDLNYLGKNMSNKKNMLSASNPLNFTLDNCISGHALLFKRELLNSIFPIPNLIPHDWWIAFNCSIKGKIVYLKEALVSYRMHNSNTLVLNRDRKSKENKIKKRQIRINEFYSKLPENHPSKNILFELKTIYNSFTVINKIKKIVLFFKYKNELFKIKKKSKIGLFFYILKSFNRIK